MRLVFVSECSAFELESLLDRADDRTLADLGAQGSDERKRSGFAGRLETGSHERLTRTDIANNRVNETGFARFYRLRKRTEILAPILLRRDIVHVKNK